MWLSLSQSHSWALLLPLISSMLLWENAACVPMCKAVNGRCQLTLEYLFNQARGLSRSTKRLTSEILNEFDKEYAKGPGIKDKIPLLCYNYSLPVPDNMTEDQDIQTEVLLKETIGMLTVWNNTLRHVITDIADLESIPGVGAFISKIRETVSKLTRLAGLLSEVKSLLNLIRLEFEEDADGLATAGLPSSHLLGNSSPLFFYHVLLGCLNYNAERIAIHVNILRCQMVPRKC
ncbi:prolactin-5A1-like [Microtus ochrogaster]|uniref:Prolactin-5A1-like n=1 Tax=Microtus ochrogaster TaxID=79684 RepID=A0ABM0KY93_MICOH|nr:prolactin-5A1-like [Microtus ochrogaster]